MAEVAPLLPNDGPGNYRVSPQKRFDHLMMVNQPLRGAVADGVVIANRRHQSSQALTTVNAHPHLIVEELDYPGGTTSTPYGKWVYLVHSGTRTFLAELYCPPPDAANFVWWKVRDHPKPNDTLTARDPAKEPTWVTVLGGAKTPIRLTCLEPGEKPTVLRCYLSPFQLSEKAMNLLIEADTPRSSGLNLSDALVQPIWSPPKPAYVALVDPLDWPVQAKEKYYLPRLDTYQSQALNDEVQAKHAIAGVLRAWIAGGDAADVADELWTQPDAWFTSFEAQIKPVRRRSEEACAYVCSCLDSPEHYVAEAALTDPMKERELHCSYALQHWMVVVARLTGAAPGLEFLSVLVNSDDRAPARFVLTDRSEFDTTFFEQFRWASLGGVGVLAELGPIWVASLHKKLAPLAAEEKAIAALQRLGLMINTKNMVRTYEYLLSEADPRKIPLINRMTVSRLAGDYDRSSLPAQDAAAARTLTTKDKVLGSVGNSIEKVRYPVQAVLEIINYSNAASAFQAKAGARSIVGLIGASVDMTALLVDVAATLSKSHVGASTLLTKSVAVLGIVSGILDGVEHLWRYGDAVNRRDYGQAVGHGIAYFGAATVAIGGVITVAALAKGAAVGSTLGPAAAIIGAAVMAAGSLLASYLKLTPYEQFANHCFLGKSSNASSREDFVWSLHDLPAPTAVQQLEVLYGLLSNYRVSLRGQGDPKFGPATTGGGFGYVDIFPGAVDPTTVLALEAIYVFKIETGVFSSREERFRFRLMFALNKKPELWATIGMNDGNMVPYLDKVEVERRDDLSVKRISIPIQPAFVQPQPGEPAVSFSQYHARESADRVVFYTRLLNVARAGVAPGVISTPLRKRVKLDVMAGSEASSLDDDFFE